MSRPYDPRSAIRRATRSMNDYVKKHERPIRLVGDGDATTPIASATEPALCVVLLKALTDGVHSIVPDDFHSLRTADGIKAHVRPDGAVFLGSFELQNAPDSLCLVYGPTGTTLAKAERSATLERPALINRYDRARLGVFGAPPAPLTPPAPLSA